MMILVTGATGFVGSALIKRLASIPGIKARAATRRTNSEVPAGAECVQVGDLAPDAAWSDALSGIDIVVHVAARVHVMDDTAVDPLSEFRLVNVQGTLSLAKQAVAAGVRRFVFISSVKVNGEVTEPGKPFGADDVPVPLDPYGISKLEAEQGLLELASRTGMEVVIIRPPLVYGPGVKANFQSMMRLLQRRVPLPFGAICNQRSLVALDNLVDLIVTCIDHPAASGQTFMVSDGEDLSTPQLLTRLGDALGKPAVLLSLPSALLIAGATLLGKQDVARRVCGSLQVDISKTRTALGWTPPLSVDEGLRRTAEYWNVSAHAKR